MNPRVVTPGHCAPEKLHLEHASGIDFTLKYLDVYDEVLPKAKTGDELVERVTEIAVPRLEGAAKQTFLKFTLRNPVDLAIVSVASVITLQEGVCTDARIALGAVAPAPVKAKKAEQVIKGRPIDQAAAAEAAEQAVAGAKPLSMNAYKIEITRTLVKRALLSRNIVDFFEKTPHLTTCRYGTSSSVFPGNDRADFCIGPGSLAVT
ncbi:MAG: hypothetical protein JSV55_08475 [Deltaproteobacteria bacterium]|nr:MAG: hypothetical protein JSV55_08475 [Deltaproteobacteria bacterium]